jgi:outer membrane protein assembly factor BamB
VTDPASSGPGSRQAPGAAAQPHDATVGYPGGLRARWRWAGSGQGAAVFALSEAGGSLQDLGPLVSPSFEALCRAELRIDGPGGSWSVRLSSTIFDEPSAFVWDDEAQLVVKYGFLTYGFDTRTGTLRWSHRSATPVVAVVGSPRLRHVVVQSEIETFAIEPDGTVGWRIAHSDVVAEAALVGGRLVLTSFTGQVTAIDPATGRVAPG